jgi:peptidoglycan-associated lipoprotein
MKIKMRTAFAILTVTFAVILGCSRVAKKAQDTGADQPQVKSADAGAPGRAAEPGERGAPRKEDTASRPSREGSLEELKRGTLGQAKDGSPTPDIHFAFDRYELTPESKSTLKALSNWITKNPEAKVGIEGHADERGTVEYNLALGAKRAQAAKDYLVNLGVSASRLSTVSYGEELPLCKESNEECWGKNRRDHFVSASSSKK